MEGIRRGEIGAIKLKGLIGILIVVLAVYVAVSMFPVVQVPFSMEGKLRDLCKTAWLYKSAQERIRTHNEFREMVRALVAEELREHSYRPDDIVINADPRRSRVSVRLPYTVQVSILGMSFNFDKELDIEESYLRF